MEPLLAISRGEERQLGACLLLLLLLLLVSGAEPLPLPARGCVRAHGAVQRVVEWLRARVPECQCLHANAVAACRQGACVGVARCRLRVMHRTRLLPAPRRASQAAAAEAAAAAAVAAACGHGAGWWHGLHCCRCAWQRQEAALKPRPALPSHSQRHRCCPGAA